MSWSFDVCVRRNTTPDDCMSRFPLSRAPFFPTATSGVHRVSAKDHFRQERIEQCSSHIIIILIMTLVVRPLCLYCTVLSRVRPEFRFALYLQGQGCARASAYTEKDTRRHNINITCKLGKNLTNRPRIEMPPRKRAFRSLLLSIDGMGAPFSWCRGRWL